MAALAAFEEHPQGVHFQNQLEGEEILLLLRQHPIVNLSWILGSLFVAIFPGVAFYLFTRLGISPSLFLPPLFWPPLLMIYYLTLLAWAHLSFWHWFFNVYLLTDRRIVDLDYWGFLFFRVSATTWDHIEDVTYTVGGGWGVFFHYGDLYIQTAGTETNFDFLKVPQPARVARLILAEVKKREGR